LIYKGICDRFGHLDLAGTRLAIDCANGHIERSTYLIQIHSNILAISGIVEISTML
jgi:hypothetical protein